MNELEVRALYLRARYLDASYERKFNPSEPRDPHGRWSVVGAALDKALALHGSPGPYAETVDVLTGLSREEFDALPEGKRKQVVSRVKGLYTGAGHTIENNAIKQRLADAYNRYTGASTKPYLVNRAEHLVHGVEGKSFVAKFGVYKQFSKQDYDSLGPRAKKLFDADLDVASRARGNPGLANLAKQLKRKLGGG